MTTGKEITLAPVLGTLTATARIPLEDMSFDQWAAYGIALCELHECTPWEIGRWWNAGRPYGDRVREVKNKLRLKIETVRQYAWAAANVSIRIDRLSFSHHAHVASLPPPQQEKWLRKAAEEDWSSNELRSEITRAGAIERTKQMELDAKSLGKFTIIYADPPWRYENPPMGGSNRSIENQYPTMTLDEIKALAPKIDQLAHDHCTLYLWVTNPKLEEGIAVLNAWGFRYRMNFAWVKDKIGMGYHARGRHELLLVGKRGERPVPLPEDRQDSVIEAVRGVHSAKPVIMYEMLDEMYPNVRKVELFARENDLRPKNWKTWGNEGIGGGNEVDAPPKSNVAPVDAKTESAVKELLLPKRAFVPNRAQRAITGGK
jgi:N6-adenosine-specific RNA methylase IME4